MKKITYVFLRGRNKKVLEEKNFANDFFYGAYLFDKNKYDVNILEVDSESIQSNKFLNFFDRGFKKFLNLPFNMEKFVSFKNLKSLKKSDHVILVNETVAFSSLPLLFILKIFSKTKISVFVMGLFSREASNKFFLIIMNIFIKIMISCVNNVLFLGKPEYEEARKTYTHKNKFKYLPFSVDTEFWSSHEDIEKTYDLIFVGNDLNKDFSFVIKLITELKHRNFLVVSNNPVFDNLEFSNSTFIKSDWSTGLVSDTELRDFYLSSRISILPIKETLQPSGQSVALQSMSLKIPVLISQTSGFWDKEKFSNNNNIIFLKNDINTWTNEINKLLNDYSKAKNIASKAHDVVLKEYNLNKFIHNLIEIINKS